MPSARSVSKIKSALLKPALTSHYEVYIPMPRGSAGDFANIMRDNGVVYNGVVQDELQLACSEATLPGSSLATLEINNDYTGVTERHAYRRIYDDRIDLTFYVDTKYTVIRFFETWMKYISNESLAGRDAGPVGLRQPNYFYTVRYPEEYQTEFSITKFERDNKTRLKYNFLKAYPISISSMPISYDSSSLLKCTVSFTYTRYYIEGQVGSPPPENTNNPQSTLNSPITQSQFNANSYQYFLNPEYATDTTGGLSVQNALSSGNSLQVFEGEEVINAVNANKTQVEAGLAYVGRNVGPLAPF